MLKWEYVETTVVGCFAALGRSGLRPVMQATPKHFGGASLLLPILKITFENGYSQSFDEEYYREDSRQRSFFGW